MCCSFFFFSLLIRKPCAGLKPLSLVFLKDGHSVLISEGLLDKLCMGNDQIDLCDFLGCNFKHMKNYPVKAPKEANLALRVALQGTVGLSERIAKNFLFFVGFLYFSYYSSFALTK